MPSSLIEIRLLPTVITLIMSGRRKSSNPCVLYGFTPGDSVEMDVSVDTVLDRDALLPPAVNESGMPLNDEEEEKSFCTRNLCNYRDHEDFRQSEGSFYVCTICSFSTNCADSLSCHTEAQHPNESGFNFRQTVDCEIDGSLLEAVHALGAFAQSRSSAGEDTGKSPMRSSSILEKVLKKELDSSALKDEIRAVSVNGTIIIPEPVSHVTPLLQRPPNLSTSPTVPVPLHTSRYNPILDSNPTLITSFNRFPYPTHAELSWLTAASRHPEEQIKVWFSTQRLKQGITWSPEEVEEARKKMFNGSILTPHQTCEISPTPTEEAPEPGQETQKRSLGMALLASEVEPVVSPSGVPRESLHILHPPAPPPGAPSPRLSETTSSNPLAASDMKRSVAEYFVPPKGKVPMVQSKDKLPVALPSVSSKERLPLSPIVSTNLKRSLIHQHINNLTSASSFVPKDKLSRFGNGVTGVTVPSAPAVNTPTLIQTLSASLMPVLQCKSIETPLFPCSQNSNEIPHGDVKHWTFDQNTNSQNPWECSVPTQFPLLERVKDKSPGQIKLLEESFQRNSFPSYNEAEHLMISTRMSREEIESWFLERRALRDYLEQALLNSMGPRRESQQPVLHRAQRRSGSSSPVPPNSRSANLVRNVFVHGRRPSPVEFRSLEVQTRLARTELVRWLRGSRLAQQNRGLDRREGFGERKGCWSADSTRRQSPKERPLREENIKPSTPENWLENMPGQHPGSNGHAVGDGRAECGGNTCQSLSDSG